MQHHHCFVTSNLQFGFFSTSLCTSVLKNESMAEIWVVQLVVQHAVSFGEICGRKLSIL